MRGIVDKTGEKGEYNTGIFRFFLVSKILSSYNLLCCRGSAPESNGRGHEDADANGSDCKDKAEGKQGEYGNMCLFFAPEK